MKKLLLKICANKKQNTTFDFSKVNSVLIRPIGAGIGDAVVLTAVLKQLKNAYPTIKIGVLASKRNEEVFKNNPLVDILLKDTFLTYLKNYKKWQVFIDYRPTFTTKNIIFDFLLAPTYTICMQKEDKKYYTKDTVKNYDFYAFKSNEPTHMNQVLTLTPLAKFVDTSTPKYYLQHDEKMYQQLLKLWPSNKVKILLSPNGSNKKINQEDLKKIILKLQEIYGTKITFLMANTSYPFVMDMKLAPKLNLKDYCMLVETADIIIAVDSATVHIANAFNKKLVAVYANSPERFLWAPLQGSISTMIVSRIISRENTLIDGFDTDEVVDAVTDLIKEIY